MLPVKLGGRVHRTTPCRDPKRRARRLAIEPLEDRSLLSGDVVLRWNAILLDAVRVDRTPPPAAARAMAMVHTAVFDSVNAIDGTYSVYLIDASAPPGASPEAAAAAAAHRVLVRLFPGQAGTFDAALAVSLADIPDGSSENKGIALGRSVANRLLAARAHDGSDAVVTYTVGSDPGDWQPTPLAFAAPLLPQWPDVTPFVMTSSSPFPLDGPPALTSDTYAADFQDVKELGRINSSTRTADQTKIALFWADGPGTFTPPGHWNQIAQAVALQEGNTLTENARLFALLNVAMADAGIAAWDAKYAFNFWRPITAIRQADSDDNDRTASDPAWSPLLATPPFPEYVSGHSTFSGAAGAILAAFFGDTVGFTDPGDPSLKVDPRSFDSFTRAADEAGRSRIYGGIHFQSANADGLAMGRAIGDFVFQNVLGMRTSSTARAIRGAAPEFALDAASSTNSREENEILIIPQSADPIREVAAEVAAIAGRKRRR